MEQSPQDTSVVKDERMEVVKGTPQPKLTPYQEIVAYRSIELTEESTLTVISAEDRHRGAYQLVADNTARIIIMGNNGN